MKDNRASILLLIVILLVVVGAAYFIVQSVRDSAQQAIAPWQQANNSLQTQVSDLLHPTPTIIPDPVTYINQIQALARLETVKFGVQQVVEADFKQGTFGFLFGSKMLCVVPATVVAGIDMQQFQPGDMQLQNGVLNVKLPPPEIFGDPNINVSKVVIYPLQTGIVAQPDPDQAVQCLAGAKDQILKAAVDDGILDLAQQNAVAYLSKFFAALGYPKTVFQTPPSE